MSALIRLPRPRFAPKCFPGHVAAPCVQATAQSAQADFAARRPSRRGFNRRPLAAAGCTSAREASSQERQAHHLRPSLPALAATCTLALLLVLLVTGCGQTTMIGASGSGIGPGGSTSTGGGTVSASGPISLSVQHQTGTQALTITLTVKNATQQPMIWDGGCVTPYTVFLRDAHNNLVQRWPPIQTGTRCNAIVVVTLPAGQSQTFAIVQTTDARTASGGTIPAGTYTVNAHFIADKYNGAGPVNFIANAQISW